MNTLQDSATMRDTMRLRVGTSRTLSRDQNVTRIHCHCTTVFIQSLLFFIIVQLTQIRYSESITTTNNIKLHREQQLDPSADHNHRSSQLDQLLIDRTVLDLDSLYKSNTRKKRSAPASFISATGRQQQQRQPVGKSVDACQSKMEILTPYYATNSKGKVRTIVNSELMQQAIQVETCVR